MFPYHGRWILCRSRPLVLRKRRRVWRESVYIKIYFEIQSYLTNPIFHHQESKISLGITNIFRDLNYVGKVFFYLYYANVR